MLEGRFANAAPSPDRKVVPARLASVLALTLLLFLPGVVPTLSGDDFVHAHRNRNPVAEWPHYFLTADGREYRPLVRVSLALDHLVWGDTYRGFHATNLALHLLAVLLVFLWGRTVLPPSPALAAAAFFAVHPIHSYSVNAVMGRTDMLCLVFLLGGLLAFEKGRPAASAMWFAAALLSKETAVVLPLLPALLLALFPEKRSRRRWWCLAAASGVVLAYLSVRFTVLPPQTADLAVYLQTSALGVVSNLFFYAGGLLLPAGGYSLRALVEGGLPRAAMISGFGLAVLLGAAGAFALLRRGLPSKVPLFALSWIPITLFPVILLFQRRFLYIPSVGFCLLLGWLLSRRRSKAPAVALALLGIAFAAASLSASLEWRQASRLTRAALPGLAEKIAAEPLARFSALNVPHGVGQAHLFTHDSLRYALALETGILPELETVTRIQRGSRGSWTTEIVPEGVLTRIEPGPQDFFVFDVPELLPRGGRFLPVGTAFRKGEFRISVAETDSIGRPSALLVSWERPPPGGRLILFHPSGRTESLPLGEDRGRAASRGAEGPPS